MSKTNRFIAAAVATVLVAVCWLSAMWAAPGDPQSQQVESAPSPSAEEGSKWMHMKLKGTQEIFDGLTHGDFQKITENSRRMLVLQLMESWAVDNKFTRRSEYQGRLNSYEFGLKELRRSAEAKDVDGSFEAYIQLTRSCVECHKLLRDVPPLGPISIPAAK